jgi:dolichol-phosphate mannosyltransferase
MSPRVARFVGVGLVGFMVQLAALGLLTRFGMPYTVASVIAVEIAILQNFVWHERWTWRDRRTSTPVALASRLIRFNAATGAVSIAGNVVLTALFVEAFGMPVLVANTLAVLTLTGINYEVADRFVFCSVRL